MNRFNGHKAGLVLGACFSLFHAFWIIAVALGAAKFFLDWILRLHFLEFSYTLLPVRPLPALLLLLITFASGYFSGRVFAAFWNAMEHRGGRYGV